MMRSVRGIRLVLLLSLVLVLAGVAWVVERPGVSASSGVNEDVTIECTGFTGVAARACGDWGDAILSDDPAPRTFEREDMRRLMIDRSMLGFGGECSVAFFISRNADRPVWTGEVACR
jgi:hypothetical protein